MKYVAGWNLPGCLPDTDESLPVFDTFEEARDYIVGELRFVADQYSVDEPEGDSWEAAAEEAKAESDVFELYAPDDYCYWVNVAEED